MFADVNVNTVKTGTLYVQCQIIANLCTISHVFGDIIEDILRKSSLV